MDIAIIPSDDIPPRFEKRFVYEEDFVIAMRKGHAFAADPTLNRFCDMQHLVVSHTGDPYGFVDEALASRSLTRRIGLTVPNFMLALATIAETSLISALPRRLVAMNARRFGIVAVDAPLSLPTFRLNAVAPKVAMMDEGLTWIFDLLARAETVVPPNPKQSVPRKRHSRTAKSS